MSAAYKGFMISYIANTLSDFPTNGICLLVHPNRAGQERTVGCPWLPKIKHQIFVGKNIWTRLQNLKVQSHVMVLICSNIEFFAPSHQYSGTQMLVSSLLACASQEIREAWGNRASEGWAWCENGWWRWWRGWPQKTCRCWGGSSAGHPLQFGENRWQQLVRFWWMLLGSKGFSLGLVISSTPQNLFLMQGRSCLWRIATYECVPWLGCSILFPGTYLDQVLAEAHGASMPLSGLKTFFGENGEI